MAKKRKKKKQIKGKPGLSPVRYIKTKCRSLTVEECLINEEWQDMGLATIVVTRKQPSGKLISGVYLVDTMCLGLKDTYYHYSLTSYEYNDIMEQIGMMQNMITCDYVLAHNIIYGAIAFAEDLGFPPHKDFSITKYFLEEDDEGVEFMDIDFGKDGVPVLFVKEGMNPNRYIKQLNHSIGEGNYEVVYQTDDLPEWDDEDSLEEIEGIDEDRPFRQYVEHYEKGQPEGESADTKTLELISYQISYDRMESEYDRLYADKIDEIFAAVEKAYPLTHEDPEQAIHLNKELIEKYPDYPAFYNYLSNALMLADRKEEADQVTLSTYEKFPDYLFAKLSYAHWLLEQEKYEEAIQVLDHKFSVNLLYPDREVFHFSEVLAFNLFMCRYFTQTGQAESAINYYKIMLQVKEDHPMTIQAEGLVGATLLKDNMQHMLGQIKGVQQKPGED